MASKPALSTTAKKNVETIAQIEQQLLHQQSGVERVGERIARFFGSLRFIAAHFFFITGWVFLNSHLIPGLKPFDPFPFSFLSLIIGIEFIFLTTFVLINQNHQARHTAHWEHLNLQLSMLAEQEITKSMEMLQLICTHLDLGNPSQDQQVKEMAEETPVAALAEEIGKARVVGETLAQETAEAKEASEELHEELKEAREVSRELAHPVK